MKQMIIPEKQTVEEALRGKNYCVDFYQREFVWSKETVEVLLNDIFYNFELSYEQLKDAELTPEVIGKFNWYYLNVFITNSVEGKVYVVDGQQRLSTLTLIAAKLYHMTDNEDLKDSLKNCIFSRQKYGGSTYNIDNAKRHEVMDAVLNDNKLDRDYRNKTEETIIDRYADISRYIDSKNFDRKKLEAFILYFLDRLVLVELTIEKDDTPMIFEVINDRGEALKPFEILKGKLVGALSKHDTDHYSEQWDAAMERLHGIEDAFFVDLLRAKYLTRRDTKLEVELNQSYHRYIFESNRIANELGFRKQDKDSTERIKTFISRDLDYYSKLYARLRTNPNRWLHYLNDINSYQSQYHIIMAACDVEDPLEADKVDVIAREMDRLMVLLRLNQAYDSNSFIETAYWLNGALKDKAVSDYRAVFDARILDMVKDKKNRQMTSVLEYGVFLQSGYSNLDTRFMRYLLARVEDYICSGCGIDMMNDVYYISSKTGYVNGYHIEHILSHNDTNMGYFGSEEEFESKRGQLGGLLLLKGRDNISSGNEEYADKLKTYSAGLVWGHTLNKDYHHINKELAEFNEWLDQTRGVEIKPYDVFDAKALEERNRLIYNLVCLIWDI